LRIEPPKSPKHDLLLIRDTSISPIVYKDIGEKDSSEETFLRRTRDCDLGNLLPDKDITQRKSMFILLLLLLLLL